MRRTRMRRTPPPKTPMFDRYKAQGPCDEILFYIGCRLLPNGKMSVHHAGRFEDAAEVDHIFSGQNRRPDLWGNFIGCNIHGHRGKHDGTRGDRNRFITLALMAKWNKHHCDWLDCFGRWRIEMADWNYAELREACGHLILPTIESVHFEDEFLESGRRNLVSVISAIES